MNCVCEIPIFHCYRRLNIVVCVGNCVGVANNIYHQYVYYVLNGEYQRTMESFDVTQQRHSPHGPVPRSRVALEVDGADVVEVSSSWFSIYRTLVQPE